MEIELQELEKHWDAYVGWAHGQGLYPDFSDYLIWLDDQDMNISEVLE